jgi:ribonuclease D
MNVDVPTCYVDCSDKLPEVLKILKERDFLAVDTEFVKIDTLYPLPALVQLYDGESFYLVDVVTLSSEDRNTFWSAFISSDAVFVFFSMHEDLDLIYYCSGSVPKKIEDLQVMLSFIGLSKRAGLADTVERYIGTELIKDQTLSTWMNRPLTDEQIRYAAMDVYYLLDIFRIMKDELTAKGNFELYRQEMNYMIRSFFCPYDPKTEYLKYAKGDLTTVQMARLKELVAFRHDTAEKLNVPLQQVIRKEILLNLCKNRVREPNGLSKAGMAWPAIKRYGAQVIKILNNSHIDTSEIITVPVVIAPLYQQISEQFKEAENNFCVSRGIQEHELASKKNRTELFTWLSCSDKKNFYTPAILNSPWRMNLLYDIMKTYRDQISPEDLKLIASYAGISEDGESMV